MTGGSVEILALQLSRKGSERIKRLVTASPFVRLVGTQTSVADFETKALQLRPSLLLMEFEPDNNELAEAMARLRAALPGTAMLMVAESREPEHILKAVRLGAREYLTDDEESARVFSEAVVRLGDSGSSGSGGRGRLVGLMGAKGGVGTSFLAANLGWTLSQVQGQRVVLLDMDLFGGNLSFLLDLEPVRGWGEVARNFDRLDDVFLEGLLLEAGPGFRLLAAPEDAVDAEEIRGEHVAAVLDTLLADNTFILVDLPPWLNDLSLTVLDRSQKMFLVTEPNIIGLKAARRILSLCQRLGLDEDKIALVANRADAKFSLKQRKVESILDRPVEAWLPNEFKALTEAGNSGRPVLEAAPKSRWSKAVSTLAESLVLPGGDE